ncbi:MAG TPA: AAA family ATPase [Chloroflexota bacterium]|nr:AAA family ATPase [Chloroflexota bacterium]
MMSPEGVPVATTAAPRQFGPLVAVEDDNFLVDGQHYPRRRYSTHAALMPVRRSPDPPSWDGQLLHLPDPAELQRGVPDAAEVFSYLTPSMVRVLRRIADVDTAVSHRGFILLVGPTGCGKTTMAKTYCHLANQPCTELSFSGDTALSDFYTSVELIQDGRLEQSTLTVPGPAVEAMLRGQKLLLNEINMLPPDLLNVFSQAMDTGRLVLSGTERGNVEIEVHGEFGLIGTANPNYVGTLDMGRAIERRFGRGLGFIEMDFLPPDEESVAIEYEFAAERLFAQLGIRVETGICRRMADLAADLRKDPQIGNVMQSRLSTRTLVHWLGLAQITGRPLVDVLNRALLSTVPPDARERAVAQARDALGDARLAEGASAKLGPFRVAWPAVRSGDAVPVDTAKPPRRFLDAASASSHRSAIHRVRFVRALPDGGKILVAEPLYADGVDGVSRFGLGVRIRAYDATGRQIVDPDRLEDMTRLLRDQDGLNVPGPLGRQVRPRELLPCLTSHVVEALELVEAALLLGRPVFVAGPTGAGKSSLARTLAFLRRRPVVEIGFTGETAKTDLSAVRRLIGGATRWQTQAFLEALAAGDLVIANEYNLAYPDVHSLLNGLFDKGARLALPDGRVYRLHPAARVVATGYLDGPGVKPLNEGVENRFGAIVGLSYPPIADEVAVLRFVAPSAHLGTIDRCVRLVDYCRRLVAGKTDPATLAGLSRASQEALRQAARRAALSTAELVAIARAGGGPDFAERLRLGILDGAPENVRRTLEPVLLQYGLAGE